MKRIEARVDTFRQSPVLGVGILTAACLGVAGLTLPVSADTLHRYGFNTNGAAEDTGTNAFPGTSLPGTDGTVLNGATVAGGVLTTTETGAGNANSTPEVTLPLGVASDFAASFTIQQWFTRSATATNTYTTAYSFSDGSTSNYMLASPGRGDGTNQYGWALKQVGVNGGAEVLLRGGVLAPGSTNAAANVYNSATGQATLYMNGVAVAQSNVGQLAGFNLSNLAIKAGINGDGPFADKAMGGSTDEFRMDDTALTATRVATNFLLGANDNGGVIATNNGTASGDYNDAATWSLGTPTATQLVVINNTKTLTSGNGLAGILRVNGTLNVNGGTLAPATNLDLTAGGTVNLNAGTLSLRGITVDGDITSTSAGAHTLNLNGGTLQAAGNYFAPATNIAVNVNAASTVDSQGFSVSLPGTVSGTATLTKIGNGTVAFTGGNSSAYTGAINVNGGTFGVGYSAGTHTGANAFSNAINLDPNNTGAAGIGFTIGQTVATDVTSTVTLGQPTVPTLYAITGGAGTNQFGNFIGRVTGGNANATLNLTGFFKFDAPTSDFVGNVQINANTAIALAGPNSFGGTTRTLISNGGGIEPQTNTALTGVNKFLNPITVLANQAIYFTGNNNIDVGSTITGTVAGGTASISDIQKSGAGVVSLQGVSTNIRNVVLNGAGGTAANPRVVQFASNFTGFNASTATARGGIVDDNQGGNNDVQYAELTGGVTVNNLVLASKGRSLVATPAVSGLLLNSASGNNTWGGGLQIVNGGGGAHVNVAAGSTLNLGGVINNNVGASNRGYELTGGGSGVINAAVIDGTYYTATPAASQLALIAIGETGNNGTTLTQNGSWSLNSTGNTLSGSIQVVGGRFNVNGSTTSASTSASNQVFDYGGTIGGAGSIAQPVYVYAGGVNITSGAFTAGFSTANPFVNFLSYIPQAAGFVTAGGAIDPGVAANTIGTLTLAKTLSVNGAVTEQIDGAGAGSADKLAVAGALTLGSASVLNLSSLTMPDDGVYLLASYGTLAGTFATINGLPSGYTLNYAYNGNNIALIGSVAPTTAYFTGLTSNSLNALGNFAGDVAGTLPVSILPAGGTDVYFASSNASTANLANATVDSNLSVNSLTFGTGAAAASPVTLGGAGTITINAANVGYAAGTGIVKQSGSAAVAINAPLALGASQSWTNSSATALTVGGTVALGGNTLTIAGANAGGTTISGAIGGGGAVIVTAAGVTTLGGGNTYTGGTTVNAASATLRVNAAASAALLTGTGTNLANGTVDFQYSGTSPAATIRGLLAASYQAVTTPGVMDTGVLRSGTATAARGIGYKDDGAGNVLVRATLFGDADLDGGVSINDFNALAGNFGQATGKVWVDGDFDYDGGVSINDFNLLAGNFGRTLPASAESWAGLLAFAAAHNDLVAFDAVTGVPEPTSIGLIAAGATMALRRRRRSA